MSNLDSRGLPITTKSDEAARLYRQGVDLLLSAWPGTIETLRQATNADPDFALAHAALARMHAICAEPVKVKTSIARAREIVARNGTPREKSHVATIAFAVSGEGKNALESALSHADQWPRDALILSLLLGAFGLFAFSGMAEHDEARVSLCEKHAPSFDADDWWFLTYRGWSHTENGGVTLGRDLTTRALELRPANANGAHALAHAMFEEGAGKDAETFIHGWLPSYDASGLLHGHIAWHAALSALERGDAKTALAIYAKHVRPAVSCGVPLNVMTDAVSLLWRIQAYGHEVPAGLWEPVKAYSNTRFPKVGLSFADIHMGLLSAATGDRGAANDRIEALTKLLEAGSIAAGPVVPAVCRAALTFADEDYAGCVRILEPVVKEAVRLGGSGAQREIIEDTLLVALMRSGQAEKARGLLDTRLHRRPSSRDTNWRSQIAA
ncbi:tetratricopeptide repeat protein [Bradyrhizobium jicamae]|uniref:Tetratricopeptide repeat protein 38 n=1 Tax=Bradyrhizobium jicamae TaxID=280332 RepID=A0ABS5FT61_9BRAD|nr:tetratricopeptide repeat protein [Bradyrhizobium jicamae]MBR0799948.1 tetratricopeptide repeat protein [Bradyrhizobium jicamae]